MSEITKREAKELFSNVIGGDGIQNFLTTYNSGTTMLLFFATFGAIVSLIINIAKISTAGSNAKERSEAIRNTFISAICFGVLSSLDIFYIILLNFVLGT